MIRKYLSSGYVTSSFNTFKSQTSKNQEVELENPGVGESIELVGELEEVERRLHFLK